MRCTLLITLVNYTTSELVSGDEWVINGQSISQESASINDIIMEIKLTK